MEADGHITTALRLPHRDDFVRGGRLSIAEERRAEKLERPASECLEQALRGVQFEQGLRLARRRKIGMRIGMASDLVPFADHALEETAPRQRILADDEEGRGHLLLLQDVEDLR